MQIGARLASLLLLVVVVSLAQTATPASPAHADDMNATAASSMAPPKEPTPVFQADEGDCWMLLADKPLIFNRRESAR